MQAVTADADADRRLPQRKGDQIYSALKHQLLRGQYELGSRLSVADLALSIGASRQPVMEALKRLQGEGFVHIIPQVGCRVAAPTASEVRDFFEVFATMEGLVSRLAAERREPAAIDELRRMVRLLDEPVNGEALTNARHAVWNRQFHGLIHRCARSLEARAAAEMYWDRSDFMIASTRPPFWRMNLERAHDEHIALLDAVADGDVTAAQQLAFSHIRSFGDAVVEHLLAAGDAGDELGQMSQRPPRER